MDAFEASFSREMTNHKVNISYHGFTSRSSLITSF